MEALRKADPRLSDLASVAEQWRTVIGPDRVTVAEVIRRATEREKAGANDHAEFAHPDFREALLAIAGTGGAINTRKLGKWLGEFAGRVVEGFRFDQCGHRQGVAVWALVRLSP
jgi:hypothetical protein